MGREYCKVCYRALQGCICCFTSTVMNSNYITILRHPSERSNIKGTAELLRLSLNKIILLDGELFDQSNVLNSETENILIFPSESSKKLSEFSLSQPPSVFTNFIFIDGTWKKAYKILQLNPYLKDLVHLNLDINSESIYSQVRKQKLGGLSTLEAVISTLKKFEEETSFTDLENSFGNFIHKLKNLTT